MSKEYAISLIKATTYTVLCLGNIIVFDTMQFTSFYFLILFFISTVLYFLIPKRFQRIYLFFLGCAIYMTYIPLYILLLGFIIAIDYIFGLGIQNASNKTKKRRLFYGAILMHLLFFLVFKYLPLLQTIIEDLCGLVSIVYVPKQLSILVPVGLSFHIFQSMSYLIEVYTGRWIPEKNPLVIGLYCMFYPQLMAGPIERPAHLLPQIKQTHTFNYGSFVEGTVRVLWGIAKKTIIADHIAILIDPIFYPPVYGNGMTVWISALLFSIQIYADFSGYTDIALGTAKALGFSLSENFSLPYLATSMNDFWKRWHHSLTSWFRDYLYIPLGGNRYGMMRTVIHIIIVFTISGIWHGATYSFILWGMVNGVLLSLEKIYEHYVKIQVPPQFVAPIRIFQWMGTYTLISLVWILFRAPTLEDAMQLYRAIFSLQSGTSAITPMQLVPVGAAILACSCAEYMYSIHSVYVKISRAPYILKFIGLFLLIHAIIFFGAPITRQFIYFQY